MVSPHQVIRGGLGGRIRAVRPVRRLLGKIPFGPQRAIDLVGAHMVKKLEALGVLPCQLQQRERAMHVGRDESLRCYDRAIDVRLGGEVADGVDGETTEDIRQGAAITDVGANETITAWKFFRDIGQILRVAGIGQLVDVDHAPLKPAFRQQIPDEVRTDESAATGDEDGVHAF